MSSPALKGLALLLALPGLARGAEEGQSLHFKPAGHSLGDVHPFFLAGECYLYYLKPAGYHSALARSGDLLRWTETAIQHEPPADGDWFSPYFVLGVFQDPAHQVYRSFYGHAGGRMASSISADLRKWSCAPRDFHIPPSDYYERRRDPYVFWIPDWQSFGCVMTTRLKGRPAHLGGAVSLATSTDLKHWTDHGPVLDPGDIGEPECPQMFRLGEDWYLLASIYDRAVGRPVYWQGSSPLGPWTTASRPLDGKDLCAAQLGFDGQTPLLFGWIPLHPAKPGRQAWGGHLALPRELCRRRDGALATRFPGRLRPALERLPWRDVPPFPAVANAPPAPGEWTRLAAAFRLRLSDDPGSEVRVRFPPLGCLALAARRLRLLDAAGECWSEIETEFHPGELVSVQLFVEDGIAEAFAGERYSLAARLPSRPGPLQLGFAADASGAEVLSLRTAEWNWAP